MTIDYIKRNSVLFLILLTFFGCSSPTGEDKHNYSYIDSLLICKDTTILSFKRQYIHIFRPTTVLFIVSSYLFYDNTDYSHKGNFYIHYYPSPGFTMDFYKNSDWNPLTYIHDTISFSANEGYYESLQYFSNADINVKISFNIIDTVNSDSEPNNSFVTAKNIHLDQYYYGYLGIFDPKIADKNEISSNGYKDINDCYSFSSDSGDTYSLIISNHDYANLAQPLKIIIANNSGVQNDYFYNTHPKDTLKINAISKITYICLQSDMKTGISYKFSLLKS